MHVNFTSSFVLPVRDYSSGVGPKKLCLGSEDAALKFEEDATFIAAAAAVAALKTHSHKST